VFVEPVSTCYTRLNHPEAAQAVLREDMVSMDPARSIHNAIVLVDLARTYIQQGEIEETCKYAGEALGIMVQLRSARVTADPLCHSDDQLVLSLDVYTIGKWNRCDTIAIRPAWKAPRSRHHLTSKLIVLANCPF
jgi:hypothetical protein